MKTTTATPARPVSLIENNTVRVERLLPGPIERVWAYITESEKRARWLARGEFDLRVGGKIALQFDNNSLSGDKNPPAKYKEKATGTMTGAITRVDPPRFLSHTWIWEAGPTEVTYELTPKGKNTLLVITHRRMNGEPLPANVMSGWDVHSGILSDLLAGREPRPFWTTHAELETEYAGVRETGL